MNATTADPEGTYLSRARLADCGNCGREMVKAHRIHQGTGYCAICYPRIFPARACTTCGKPARAHRNDDNPTCGECLREDRSCLRCGKLTPKASLRVGQRVACASCAHYYRAPEPCDMCDTPSTRLSRSTAFPHNGRMCPKCLRAAVGATCSHCGKHRTVGMMTLERKPICKDCCADPQSQHDCPDCGVPVNGAGVAPCMGCSIKRSNVTRQRGAQQLLVNESVRSLYANFTLWGNDTGRASKLAAGGARYLQFLAKLDAAIGPDTGPLHEAQIVDVFTTEELRQMGLLTQFLAETGLLNDDASARRRRSEERLLSAKRLSIAHEPWAADIQRFDEALSSRVPPLSLRTRKAYLHAATSLFEQAQATTASQIGQPALDRLVTRKPGLRASLSAFVSHVNQLHGLRLKIKSKRVKPIPLVRQAKLVRTLLDGIHAASDRPARLAMTAKLLAKLLNAPLDRILRLRHSDLDLQDFRHLKLDGRWFELPQQLHPILAALPSAQWREGLDADPLLFEGRMLMDSLSTSAVDYHVRPVVRARLGA